ncbi:hypothetical protein QCA50_007032 [Cerrena zonata]|uniref:Uncharacterized protein n=1 Tax=Cerrena zonata TaxID=2478898 RepID=A0AAW0GFC9_9APHY
MAVESPQDPHNRPTGSDSSLAPEDVLRAAALRSLKEKRKKQQSVSTELPTTLPPRPVIFDSTSIQLDYGQAESPSSIASSSGPPPASSKPEHKMDVDDAAREEGEISDSEEPPPTPASPVAPKQQPKKSSTPPAKLRPMSPQSPQRKKPPTPPTPLTAIPRPSPITTESLRPKDSELMTDMPPPPLPVHKNTPSIVVDHYQARPGLNMTQEQFETAKDIVLDLLGWGVPPEYLVNCGLSREIIFYVFTELDLKYPTNFDFSDLNVPESYLTLAASTPSTPQPEVVLYGDRAPYSPTSLAGGNYRAQGHPSLPQKPSAPQGSSLVVPPSPVKLSASATPFVPTTSPKLDEASLLDMEQQRRRELLARKAAISSRRKLTASSSDTATPSASTSLSPTTLDAETIKNLSGILERAQSSSSVVAKETVDDFLKSIGPVADEKPSVEAEPPRIASRDSMDVDEIPGLTTVDPSLTRQLSANASLSSISSSQSIASSIAPTEAPISDNQSFRASSSEVDRRDVENMMDVDESGSSTNAIVNAGSRSSSSSSGRETGQSRRAGKQRPVAADFVDFEPPRPPGYGPYRDHPRKRASFTGVTTSRRMVIELSDSEDEDVNAAWSAVTARYRPYPPTSQNRSGAQSAAGSSRAPTPAALLEKEMEIKRMREMIARREREKLKKLTTSTTSTPPAPSALANEIVVKQEEDDSASSASLLQASHNAMSEEPSREPTIPPSSVTTSPPPTPNDAASQEREDTPSIGDRVFVDPIRQQQVARIYSPVCAVEPTIIKTLV